MSICGRQRGRTVVFKYDARYEFQARRVLRGPYLRGEMHPAAGVGPAPCTDLRGAPTDASKLHENGGAVYLTRKRVDPAGWRARSIHSPSRSRLRRPSRRRRRETSCSEVTRRSGERHRQRAPHPGCDALLPRGDDRARPGNGAAAEDYLRRARCSTRCDGPPSPRARAACDGRGWGESSGTNRRRCRVRGVGPMRPTGSSPYLRVAGTAGSAARWAASRGSAAAAAAASRRDRAGRRGRSRRGPRTPRR